MVNWSRLVFQLQWKQLFWNDVFSILACCSLCFLLLILVLYLLAFSACALAFQFFTRTWRSGLPAPLRTSLKEAPSSFRATRDVVLSASHVAATALLHKHCLHMSGMKMRSVTWIRFPIKKLCWLIQLCRLSGDYTSLQGFVSFNLLTKIGWYSVWLHEVIVWTLSKIWLFGQS